jgi:hypothetical protein
MHISHMPHIASGLMAAQPTPFPGLREVNPEADAFYLSLPAQVQIKLAHLHTNLYMELGHVLGNKAFGTMLLFLKSTPMPAFPIGTAAPVAVSSETTHAYMQAVKEQDERLRKMEGMMQGLVVGHHHPAHHPASPPTSPEGKPQFAAKVALATTALFKAEEMHKVRRVYVCFKTMVSAGQAKEYLQNAGITIDGRVLSYRWAYPFAAAAGMFALELLVREHVEAEVLRDIYKFGKEVKINKFPRPETWSSAFPHFVKCIDEFLQTARVRDVCAFFEDWKAEFQRMGKIRVAYKASPERPVLNESVTPTRAEVTASPGPENPVAHDIAQEEDPPSTQLVQVPSNKPSKAIFKAEEQHKVRRIYLGYKTMPPLREAMEYVHEAGIPCHEHILLYRWAFTTRMFNRYALELVVWEDAEVEILRKIRARGQEVVILRIPHPESWPGTPARGYFLNGMDRFIQVTKVQQARAFYEDWKAEIVGDDKVTPDTASKWWRKEPSNVVEQGRDSESSASTSTSSDVGKGEREMETATPFTTTTLPVTDTVWTHVAAHANDLNLPDLVACLERNPAQKELCAKLSRWLTAREVPSVPAERDQLAHWALEWKMVHIVPGVSRDMATLRSHLARRLMNTGATFDELREYLKVPHKLDQWCQAQLDQTASM